MMKFLRFVLLALPLISPASASERKQVSLPVGHTTTVTLPAPITRVRLDETGLVEVKKQGRAVTFVGIQKGTTDVTVSTADGEVRFRVFVAEDRFGMP